jgi:LysR family transcriptional regulator of gallate degradation
VKYDEAQRKLIDDRHGNALAINLRHLRAAIAVSNHGSIARAAEELFRVSSAVTRSIAELEQALGLPLFERRARGVVANAYGESVLLRARRIEHEFDLASEQLVARGGVKASHDLHSTFASILNGRRLAILASLAERRSITAVAREFGVTQPGISAALKDLEVACGVPIFERSARGMAPTQAGEILIFHCRRVLSELRHIMPDLAAIEGRLQGSITVGALPLGRTHILPLAIASLLRRHPQLHVATVESPYAALSASLLSGDVDFILGALRNVPQDSEIAEEPLMLDRISVIARAGHPLAGRRVDFKDMRHAAWVLSRRGAPSRELFDRFFSDARQGPPQPSVETGDLAVLRCLLLESDMLTAISAHQLRYEIHDGSLVVIDFPLDRTLRQIGISLRQGALPSPGARALMDEVRNVVMNSPEFRV